MLEYAAHLHDHFVDPVVIQDGHYMAPTAPGYSVTFREETLTAYAFPSGEIWATVQ